jgi:flagellar P-ring protein FlgI
MFLPRQLSVPLVAVMMCVQWSAGVETQSRRVAVRDIASVEGVRENPLLGYGIVVGLNGTGDRRQTMFTIQTLANALQRMGVQIPTSTARVNNMRPSSSPHRCHHLPDRARMLM